MRRGRRALSGTLQSGWGVDGSETGVHPQGTSPDSCTSDLLPVLIEGWTWNVGPRRSFQAWHTLDTMSVPSGNSALTHSEHCLCQPSLVSALLDLILCSPSMVLL